MFLIKRKSASTKLTENEVNFAEVINGKINSGKIEELLLIYPTNRKVRFVKKEIISSSPNKSTKKINIETLTTFTSKLLGVSHQFVLLSEAASAVFLKQAVNKVTLRYFSNYKDEIPNGTLNRIKDVISEYKRNGILPQDLRNEAAKLQRTEAAKALDMADIYEVYKQKCWQINAYEVGDIYEKLNGLDTEEKVKNFRKLYPDVNLILVEGFDELTEPEIKIINFISALPDLTLVLNFNYDKNNPSVFSHLDKTYRTLKRYGFGEIKTNINPVNEEKNSNHKPTNHRVEFYKHITKSLFKARKNEKKRFEGIEIVEYEANDRVDEVKIIAKKTKELIAINGIEPHKICVVFNLIQNYSTIIRDVFDNYGIPFNLTDRITLSTSQPIVTIINFLEIIENDFYYKNILRALSTGYLNLADVNISNLLDAAIELKIVGGERNWFNSLDDAIKNLELNSNIELEEKESKVKKYKSALESISKISELLNPFKKKLTIKNFKKELEHFIFSSALPFKLLNADSDYAPFIMQNRIAEENIKSVVFFFDTINEVFDLIEKEEGSEKKYTLQFFLNQIRTAASTARFNIKERSNYGVLVTNLEEIRGLEFDYVFIGGMCDGDLPTKYTPEIFFSGSFLKKAITHQSEERFRFYQALNCWKKGLYLMAPLHNNTEELSKSIFLKEIEDVIEIEIKNEKAFEETLYNEQELLEEIGKITLVGANKFYSEELRSKNINVEKLEKVISIDRIRVENPFLGTPFTGFLIQKGINDFYDDKLSQKINDALSFYKDKEYSVSQLETYAKCPFKFFMERILKVGVREEPTEEIEALEMGNILHSILFEFYSELRRRNLVLKNCSDVVFNEASEIMKKIAKEKINIGSFNSPVTFYEKEKILGFNDIWESSLLYKFLEEERNGTDNFIPSFFEVSFGTLKKERIDELLSLPEPIEIDGIKLRGKIDRIDISEADKLFNIVDYKLGGKKPSSKELKDGISLQLPVYLYAASELLKKKYEKDFLPNEMIIYSLKYSADKFGKDPVSIKNSRDKEITTAEQLIDLTIHHIKKYIQKISEGEFCLSPHENREQIVCSYCQFKSVCRIEEMV
ncbi:PD-(D/E)XK nuclease family protein [Melioribacteraceae bacterium 4301-Me]|uniref:PD-(D/E)XK nuclease family protein n=1 Tax=Pyranulibacter aquaticus TaxID=3163344 RepID=UPI00359621D0